MNDSDTNKKRVSQSLTPALVPRLVALSLDPANGFVSAERLRAILDTLAQRHRPAVLKPLLKAFQTALRREILRREIHIEHAGTLPALTMEQLTTFFEKKYSRRLAQVVSPNPALFAGLRVRIGDDLYEASASATLEKLAAALAA
ncbi:MAG: F0F1 ATP synthase subunit delta [Puniceicoccales bacterium]|jgi:F-type H+-transporting ATPase subunit delta|nr:F0F1 ATP synthase subunit delta [Puniceicoccales bacterium]